MTPVWWVTWVILGLYATNSAWLLLLGKPWAAFYWLCALGISVAAMKGFTSP